MTAVTLRGIRKVHPGGQVAVAGVDLEIASGEFFVLLGPSGCGKTTLLRTIAGLDDPTAGEVLFDGVPVDRPTNRRGLAMMFQTSALYPHLSVRENLSFPLRMARCRPAEIDERVDGIARLLGIAGLLDRRPRRLSGGQIQRVAMGRALVRRPDLVLMDEPMSDLDAHLRTELRGEIAKLHRRLGFTTVYVTHDQIEAMALADRIAVMRAGCVVQSGSPDELYRRPAGAFVASFLGAPPMNLLLGSVAPSGAQSIVRLGGRATFTVSEPVRPGPVIVGVRPEHVRFVDGGDVIAEAVLVERLGHEDLVHLRVDAPSLRWADGERVVTDGPSIVHARIDRAAGTTTEPSLWRPVGLEFDRLHLFEPDDGRLIGTAAIERSVAA